MRDINFFRDIIFKFRLTVLLVLDKRVAIYVKLIPLAALIYLVVPFDLMIGPIDDAALIMGAMQLFISLCPEELVEEHSQGLEKRKETTKASSIRIIDSHAVDEEK
ncbi:MAG TPA: hypothetical protein DCK95_08185 [Anaerolineaceae bacterium]|uniref:DUF1232 domain-containing protein n=1 Tax=Anaerolinea thermophila TaxID=167964 RepID=A0A101FX26_9CHLR|nr:MAG: hypothetical protein XD73_1071 [Anaerolinea thermophila]HAF62289.1 hypothetical protein [Anaerolineaceae bacterium]